MKTLALIGWPLRLFLCAVIIFLAVLLFPSEIGEVKSDMERFLFGRKN